MNCAPCNSLSGLQSWYSGLPNSHAANVIKFSKNVYPTHLVWQYITVNKKMCRHDLLFTTYYTFIPACMIVMEIRVLM